MERNLKLFPEKSVKKLDLNSLKSINSEKSPQIQLNLQNLHKSENSHQSKINSNNEKEIYLEKLITKDYEHLIQFSSQESLFSDKLVNLQNPYFYIPVHLKQNDTYKNNIFQKHKKENDDFCNKISNKFSEPSNSKSNVLNSSYKNKKGI